MLATQYNMLATQYNTLATQYNMLATQEQHACNTGTTRRQA
jgi:hypothetical protein